MNACKNLQDTIKDSIKKFGHDINVMVLEENMDIGILRKESKTAEPEMFCVNCDAVRYGKYCEACGNILNTSLRII